MAEAKPTLVVDASVVLKWQLSDEDDTHAALALRKDYLEGESIALSAPHLLIYELTNALWAATRRLRLAPDLAREALGNFLECDIALRMPAPEKVLEIAMAAAVTAYDAAYVALAEELGAELWTADRALFEAASPRFAWVRWIGDYGV